MTIHLSDDHGAAQVEVACSALTAALARLLIIARARREGRGCYPAAALDLPGMITGRATELMGAEPTDGSDWPEGASYAVQVPVAEVWPPCERGGGGAAAAAATATSAPAAAGATTPATAGGATSTTADHAPAHSCARESAGRAALQG